MAEDPSCEYVPAGGKSIQIGMSLSPKNVQWTPEALQRLAKMPIFLRSMVKKKLEERASLEGVSVTPELMTRHRLEREQELGLKFK